jgi:hypothetical protein
MEAAAKKFDAVQFETVGAKVDDVKSAKEMVPALRGDRSGGVGTSITMPVNVRDFALNRSLNGAAFALLSSLIFGLPSVSADLLP